MKQLISVSYIDQTEKYPTGCESISAVMLLNYLGILVTAEEFIDGYLEKDPMEHREGKLFGPDPWKKFAGSPYDSESFGCYAPVIEKALNRVFTDHNIAKKAVDLTKSSMEKLCADYIDWGMPVVFWASIDLKETVQGPCWQLADGSEFMWISNEHCMLFVGYDSENYYFNDPWMNHGCIGYPRELVEQRHREQREMAVSVVDIESSVV